MKIFFRILITIGIISLIFGLIMLVISTYDRARTFIMISVFANTGAIILKRIIKNKENSDNE